MHKIDIVLAAMSPAQTKPFTPLQIQKLFFLLDENVLLLLEKKPLFNFEPFAYGPFDKKVYHYMEKLQDNGLVEINNTDSTGYREYRLTLEGYQRGDQAFGRLPKYVQSYIKDTVEWMRSHSFREIVSAIYGMYPDMAINSVLSWNQE